MLNDTLFQLHSIRPGSNETHVWGSDRLIVSFIISRMGAMCILAFGFLVAVQGSNRESEIRF